MKITLNLRYIVNLLSILRLFVLVTQTFLKDKERQKEEVEQEKARKRQEKQKKKKRELEKEAESALRRGSKKNKAE